MHTNEKRRIPAGVRLFHFSEFPVMQVRDLRRRFTALFRENGFESPELEADFIISEVLHVRGLELPLRDPEMLTGTQQAEAEGFLRRRLAHEPFQYIFGWTPFRELDLKVGPGVLIPRPETEFMLDSVLKKLPRNAVVCELGTGSGAIALSLAFERRDLTLYGSEISPAAFHWSELNRKAVNLPNVHFFQGSLYDPFPPGMKFDAVIANLPYIAEEERPQLPANVRDYEPSEALFASDHGYALLEQAIREAPAHLKTDHAQLFFEIGETQGKRLLDFIRREGFFTNAEILADQYGVPRQLFAERC
ncbi:MAG: peptide chain release factor N(5)-glutamine methyltransferase [Lentisphaeria bacterium]|nr:peptide chain release factor N(5)-glutamine methyltransferase [Lentisphaeria bacterium]